MKKEFHLNLVHRIIDRCLQAFAGLSLALLVVLTFVQVLGRYFFGRSYAWVEELSVLILCWVAWTTACLVLRDNRHLKMTFILDKIPVKWRRLVTLSMGVIILIFLGIVVYTSKGTIEAMSGISFVALPLPLNAKYLAVPVGAVLLAYYVIRGWQLELKRLIHGDD